MNLFESFLIAFSIVELVVIIVLACLLDIEKKETKSQEKPKKINCPNCGSSNLFFSPLDRDKTTSCYGCGYWWKR